jgi:CcmD family protein
VIENVGFIISAFVVVWGGIAVYAVSLARRRGRG